MKLLIYPSLDKKEVEEVSSVSEKVDLGSNTEHRSGKLYVSCFNRK